MSRIRKAIIFNIIFLTVIINLVSTNVNSTKEVKLNQGIVLGKVETTFLKHKEYYAFRGVPYAEPPVGSLRFQPPKAVKSWSGIQEALTNRPTCMQFSARLRNNEPTGMSGSEDCLYISVYTPDLEGSYPVVVFDYNDNFRTGFNGTDTYSPDFFLEEEVIVVTISHRLGLFGYLTTEDDVIPANNGIRDFILGLQWVKENIHKFGGDKGRVTLMGNKGGAALINILLYSEKAKGLFSAAMLHSGTALETGYFYPNPRTKAFEFGDVLDIKTDDSKILLEELQRVGVEKLILNEGRIFDSKFLEKNQISLSFPFVPVIELEHENAVISVLPEKGKIVNDVPVVIGLTSREGIDLISDLLYMPMMLEKMFSGISIQLPIRTEFRFDPNSTVYQKNAAIDVNEFYYKDGYLHPMNIPEYAVLVGDVQHSYAVDFAAKKLAKDLESPVFYFLFDYRGTLNENSQYIMNHNKFKQHHWGATVTDELCYLHLCSRIKYTYSEIIKLVSEQTEMKVLKKMVKLWTNFIKTRNPTLETNDATLKGITWKPMAKDKQDADYLHINKYFKMKTNPLGRRAKFWDIFFDKYGKMAVDGVVGDNAIGIDEESVRDKLRKLSDGADGGENYEGHNIVYFKVPKPPKPTRETPVKDDNQYVEKVKVVNHDEF